VRGALAEVFSAPNALAALYLGASAPIVLDKLAQGAMPTVPPLTDPEDDS